MASPPCRSPLGGALRLAVWEANLFEEPARCEIFGFLGPNGPDQSTSIRRLFGHDPPDADGTLELLRSVWLRDPDGNLIELANRGSLPMHRAAVGHLPLRPAWHRPIAGGTPEEGLIPSVGPLEIGDRHHGENVFYGHILTSCARSRMPSGPVADALQPKTIWSPVGHAAARPGRVSGPPAGRCR